MARLLAEGNDLAADQDLTSEVALGIELVAGLALARRAGTLNRTVTGIESVALGSRRAAADIHPSASLRAASIAFEEIYPDLLSWEPETSRRCAIDRAVALQQILGEIVLDAATGYVDTLLTRLNSVHVQERRSIAGQLHDQTAQSIASALQRLGYESVRTSALRCILESALDEVRSVAFDLRQYVADQRLHEAVGSYLAKVAPTDRSASLRQVGVPRSFAPLKQEETFLIIREAFRNATKHGDAAHICVNFDSKDHELSVIIDDDGRGFDRGLVGASRMGLIICRERAESIGALFEITSAPGKGTSVEVRVPL